MSVEADPWVEFRARPGGADPWADFRQRPGSAPPPAAPTAPRPSALDAAGQGLARGLTFGFNDEIAGVEAGIGGLLRGEGFSGPYAAERDRVRQYERGVDAAQPVASLGGQVVGGVGTALATAPVAAAVGLPAVAARAAGYLAPITSRLNALLPAAPGLRAAATTVAPLATAAGRGVVSGAAGGALAGFGEGEGGLEPRLANAGEGAGYGAAIGGVLAPAVRVAAAVTGRAGHLLGLRNPEVAADRQVIRALERDGVTLDQADVALRDGAAAGAPVAVADVGGRNVAQLAGTAANIPGDAMQAADRLVEVRRAGRPERLMAAGDEAFGGGSGGDVATARMALETQRRAEAGPLYERARRIELTPDEYARVDRFVADPIGQDAMQRGLRVIQLEHLARGEEFNPAAYGVVRGEGGRWVAAEGATPNMRLMDAVKRGYDEIVEEFRDPTSGRLALTQYGRAVNDARGAYRDTLAGMFPPYRRALEAWAGPSQSLEAIDVGRRAFRVDPDTLGSRASGPQGGASDFVRLGAGRAFADDVSDPARASGRARALLEDRRMQARLNALLPPEAQEALNVALRREVDMAAVERTVSPRAGSATARNLAGAADMADDPIGPVTTGLLQGFRQGGVGGGVNALMLANRRSQGINPTTAGLLGNRLLSLDPAENAAAIAALRERLLRDQARAILARRLASPLLTGIGAGSNDAGR